MKNNREKMEVGDNVPLGRKKEAGKAGKKVKNESKNCLPVDEGKEPSEGAEREEEREVNRGC